MKYLVLDTETGGLHPPPKPASGVVQIAWAYLNPETLAVEDSRQFMVNPLSPIHPEASKVHGWYDSDVVSFPPLEDVARFDGPTTIIGHNCLTGDHEVLTTSGWVRLDECQGFVTAACWSSDGKVQFENCGLVTKDFSGSMLSYSTLFHCGVYTPEHRVIFTKTSKLLAGGSPEWEVRTVKDFSQLGPNSVAIPSSGVADFGEDLFTEDEARVLEMVRADGNIDRDSVRLKLVKQRKVERCRFLLDKLGVPYSVQTEERTSSTVFRFNLLSCEFRTRLVEFLGRGKDKGYSSNILRLSLRVRKAIISEMEFWDSCKVASKHAVSKAQFKLSTSKASEANWIQAMLVCSGFTSRMQKVLQRKSGFSVAGNPLYYVSVRPRAYVKTLEKPTGFSHAGKVYCLTTPTGAFLVRRGGTVWVTGNCSFDLKFVGHTFQELSGQVCTLNLARHYVKGSKNHKLETLAEYLNLSKGKAHDAQGDVITTISLLKHISEVSGLSLPALALRSATEKVFHRMPFGKHKDRPLHQVPTDYLEWFSRQDIEGDLKKTIEIHLKTR